VENILLIGQMLVSIALMASVLLQARGAGLGATFGGDSSVYRSRRGIEKRLFQFTIILAILFVIFSVAAFRLSATTAAA
jgi:preprotein translocase subunit SecG